MNDSALKAQLATLARYNVWATQRLYGHADALGDDDYRRDVGLFFKSVHGTLNHLLVGEHQLWFRRFAEGLSPTVALNAEVEPDRAHLRQRLIDGAAAWGPFIAKCDDTRLAGTLNYTTTKGVAMSLPFAATLAHVFNHGTHHRGQISAALTAMGHACPELDLVGMLQAENRTT
ncbi:MAG: DinB family protein [Rhizobacter sp.]|nr:DinB family protein [Rhizobacter sp.]